MKRKMACALVLLLLRSAGTPAAEDPKVPTFGTSVTIASLPVFVTDGDGRAVPDLRVEDFEVEDDGKPAAIVGFTAFDANDPDLSQKLEDAPAARRQFLLLFDASFTPMHGLAKAREAGLEFISRRLAPADLVGVAVYSSVYGMKPLVKFTADHDQARRAVESLGAIQIDRQAERSAWRMTCETSVRCWRTPFAPNGIPRTRSPSGRFRCSTRGPNGRAIGTGC